MGILQSLPTRERGLKPLSLNGLATRILSLPTRERGLKLVCGFFGCFYFLVAPYAGAWIETQKATVWQKLKWSLPTRERGLKPKSVIGEVVAGTVAPYAGAWIETGYTPNE